MSETGGFHADDLHKKRQSLFSKASKRNKRAEKFRKYIGNRTEGQGFADKRKRKVQYEYLKTLKKERRQNEHRKDHSECFPNRQSTREKDKGMFQNRQNLNRFTKVAEESWKRKELKQKEKEEALRKKQEKEEALKRYYSRKKDNFKKLCKKTQKGQPVMKNQMEYLLSKIEKQVNNT